MTGKISFCILTEKIGMAFAEVPYPGDDNILDEIGKREYQGVNFLRGRVWRSLLDEYDEKKKEVRLPGIIDLTDAAFHYFLPGYMIVTAKYYEEFNQTGAVMDHLILYEEGADKWHLNKKNLERFKRFSVAQKHAVRLFLEYLIQEYSEDLKDLCPDRQPGMALAQYWNNY